MAATTTTTTDEQTLASLAAVDSSSFQIDPSLTHDDDTAAAIFLTETNKQDEQDQDDDHTNGVVDAIDIETETDALNSNQDHGLDDATVSAIKQSLSQAQAHADRQARQQKGREQKRSRIKMENEENAEASGSNEPVDPVPTGRLGELGNPIADPQPCVAPFNKPVRGDDTPFPENYTFQTRANFDSWFEGESSWCHFVQRRTTTPEKRADERLKARLKAHEAALAKLPPDEAANAPAFKRRKRARVSAVKQKITYTCHHAGSYSTKHSDAVPPSKLRMKTKTSVKCNCSARILVTEMESGFCRASYYWKHQGHDPYVEGDGQGGRLPRVLDDWILAQVQAGKDTTEIRRVLTLTEDEKQAYLQKVSEDPSQADPDMPPPLAFQMQIKYTDVYNRFRKLRGPIRAVKPPTSRRSRNQSQRQAKNEVLPQTDSQDQVGTGLDGSQQPGSDLSLDAMQGTGTHSVEQDNDQDPSQLDSTLLSHQFEVGSNDLSSGYDLGVDLSNDQHSDLARALMRIPGDHTDSLGGGVGVGGTGEDSGVQVQGSEGNHHDARLTEALNIARMAAEHGEGEGGGDGDGNGDGEAEQGQEEKDETDEVDWADFAV